MTDTNDPAAVAAELDECLIPLASRTGFRLDRATVAPPDREALAAVKVMLKASDALHAAAARIADLERERQRQSIEGAPIDTMILAWRKRDAIPEIVVVDEDEDGLLVRDARDLRSKPIWREWDEYTHWAPIPPFPESGGGGE